MKNQPWQDLSLNSIDIGIQEGTIDPCELTEFYLSRINTDREKDKIFIKVFENEARAQAEAARKRAKSKTRLSPCDGIPLAWKDNVDIAGKPTSAGIPALAIKPAQRDAAVYKIASQAGFICVGKTNMTELAFSGIGINPSYGTPRNPFDSTIARVPGGSSSGSAVAVAKGLCAAAVGTDTGGSIRIPAVWNNLVGLKTTAGLISTAGVVPLSPTLDTVGFLTRTVEDAALLHSIFTQTEQQDLAFLRSRDAHLLVCANLVWEDIDTKVQEAVEKALEKITESGARLTRDTIPEISETISLVNTKGNIVHYEGYKNWGAFLNQRPEIISPDILAIFNMGARISQQDIAQAYTGLKELQEQYIKRTQGYSAVLMPTVVHIPPVIADLHADSDLYAVENALALRNTRLVNLLGLCAVSIPVGFTSDDFPVGLMLVGAPRSEIELLQVAAVLEKLFVK